MIAKITIICLKNKERPKKDASPSRTKLKHGDRPPV